MLSLDSYQAFYDLLTNLAEDETPTVLTGKTDGGRALMMSFGGGSIHSIFYAGKRDLDALPDMRSIRGLTYDVKPLHSPLPRKDLPPASALLKKLRPSQPTRPREPAPEAPPTSPPQGLDVLNEKICDLLHNYVGPVAPMLCREVKSKAGQIKSKSQVKVMIGQIALEIEDAREADAFSREAETLADRWFDAQA